MLHVTPLQRNKATRAKGTSAALPLGRHTRSAGWIRFGRSARKFELSQPPGRGRNGRATEVEPRSCRLYNYLQRRVGKPRYQKWYQPILVPDGRPGTTPGWRERYRRNNKPPQKRGFEGLVGVDAPPAEVSGNLVLVGPDTRPVKRLWYQIFVTLRKCQKAIQPPPMIPPFQCLDSRCFGPGSVNPPTRGSVQGGGDNLL